MEDTLIGFRKIEKGMEVVSLTSRRDAYNSDSETHLGTSVCVQSNAGPVS